MIDNSIQISIRHIACNKLIDGCSKKEVKAIAKEYNLDEVKLLKWQEKALLPIKKFDASPQSFWVFDVIPLLNKLRANFIKIFFPALLN